MAVVRANAYDEVLEFLISGPTPEQVIAFRPSETTQERISHLLDANRNGALTSEEQAELDEFEQIEHLMRRLKIHAHTKLQQE
jgi:hypothetical protein